MKKYLTIMVLILSANAYACKSAWFWNHCATEAVDDAGDVATKGWDAVKSFL
jgi:hypothetical protein